MKLISVSTVIAAPADLVWQILSDGPAYRRWNPFITQLEGRLAVGQRLRVRIAPPGGRAMTFRPTVTSAQPAHHLAWLGRLGVPGVFDGAHSFTLEPLSDGRTRFTQSETFRGLLAPVMGGVLARTERGFAAMNEALRTRAERLRHDAVSQA